MTEKKVRNKVRKKRKVNIVLYFYMVLILLILTTVCTYAWFSLSKTPRVSNLSLYISSQSGLELSLDPTSGEWTQEISYKDLFPENYKLLPATWSEENQRFYGAVYTFDGRTVSAWEPLTDERHANKQSRDNYYCIGTFYARTNVSLIFSLAEAKTSEDGKSAYGTYFVGKHDWSADRVQHINSGKGAENAIRVGIRITPVNEDMTLSEEESVFYIYEPNSDAHSKGEQQYIATPSIDGSDTLIPDEYHIRQSASYWTESDPVLKDSLVYHLGKFQGSTDLYELEKDHMVQIKLYFWLEGQDKDCLNAVADAWISGNIQFSVRDNSSGLQPIVPGEDTNKETTSETGTETGNETEDVGSADESESSE